MLTIFFLYAFSVLVRAVCLLLHSMLLCDISFYSPAFNMWKKSDFFVIFSVDDYRSTGNNGHSNNVICRQTLLWAIGIPILSKSEFLVQVDWAQLNSHIDVTIFYNGLIILIIHNFSL